MELLKIVSKWLLLLMVGPLVLTFCTKEMEIGPPFEKGEEKTFYLDLPAPVAVKMRSLGTEDENRIEDITVLVFHDVSKQLLYKKKGSELIVAPGATEDNKWKFSASIPVGTYDLIAVANASASLSSVEPGPAVTKDIVAKRLVLETSSLTLEHKWNPVLPIPMWAELNDITLTESSAPTFKMTRMLARINVSFAGTVTNFVLTSIRYYNYNTKGYIIPEAGKYTTAPDGTVTATAPSVYNDDTGMGKQVGECLVYSGADLSGNTCLNTIYVFEAGSKGHFPGPNDDWSTYTEWVENPCLVLGGKFGTDAAESYYRIDFIRKENKNEWLSLLRNFSYNISVNAVQGAGYTNPRTACSSAPMNMDVSMYVVDESETGSVSMDGPYYLTISDTELTFTSSDGTSKKITLKTNYTVSGWTADLYNDPACTERMTDGWISLNPANGTGTKTGTPVDVTLSDLSVRTGYIKFTVGRMSLVSKVSRVSV